MVRQSPKERLNHIEQFYELLELLVEKVGGYRTLEICHGRMKWPRRGVYFFFELGEERTTSGIGPRVVRVGTHALKRGGKATLWTRLRQHKGNQNTGEGNHRGSVFRKHFGSALIERDNWKGEEAETWGVGSTASREVRQKELPLEQAVSQHIRKMPFLWLKVDDEPGPESLRGYIERNTIALLSNSRTNAPIDPPSKNWLGFNTKRKEIKQSGLWNVKHTDDEYDLQFLTIFAKIIEEDCQNRSMQFTREISSL